MRVLIAAFALLGFGQAYAQPTDPIGRPVHIGVVTVGIVRDWFDNKGVDAVSDIVQATV